MAKPVRRKGSRNLQFRRQTPSDLWARREELAAIGITIAREVGKSLRTADPREAKLREAQLSAEWDMTWQSYRTALAQGPRTLSQEEVFALAAEISDKLISDHSANPGVPEDWLRRDGSAQRKLLRQERSVKALFDLIDTELACRHLVVTPGSRQALIDQFLDTDRKIIFETLARRARGDYSKPEPLATRPKVDWEKAKNGRSPDTPALSFDALHHLWVSRRGGRKAPTDGSQDRYKFRLDEFALFLKHQDAAKVTPEDVERYRNHLQTAKRPKGKRGAGKPLSAKTISDRINSISTCFEAGVKARKLARNPAEGLIPHGPTEPQRAFKDHEAMAILLAARQEQDFIRWGPWLMAYSGMRAEEAGQLRKSDVFKVEGVWIIRIDPEAGHVKNDKARFVPLHSALEEEGFLAFVESVKGERLFPKACLDRHGNRKTSAGKWADGGARLTGRWFRKLGIEGVQPNHGWRHWFKKQYLRNGMSEEAYEKIVGHSSAKVGRRSYSPELDAFWLKSQIEKLPAMPIRGVMATGECP
jgi:integrase